MKYRVPTGCARLSHAGSAVTIAGDGSLDLDPTVAALLAPHGIVPVGDPAPIDASEIGGMVRADLVAGLAARNVVFSSGASDRSLRDLLRQSLAKPSR